MAPKIAKTVVPLKAILKKSAAPPTGILKKPAASTAAAADPGTELAIPAAALPKIMALEDPDERRRAYGRLETAAKTGGDAEALRLYEEAKKKPGNQAIRQLLDDWTIDPRFGRAKLRFQLEISRSESMGSDDEVVSAAKLKVLEGEEGYNELKDILPKTKDKYGREAFVYSVTRASRRSKRKGRWWQTMPRTEGGIWSGR